MNDKENKNELAESLLLAMTDIDDFLIEEAAPAQYEPNNAEDEKVVEITGADLIRSNKRIKKYLLAVACLAIVAVTAVPLISSLNGKNSNLSSSISDSDIADSASAYTENSEGTYDESVDNYSGVLGELEDSYNSKNNGAVPGISAPSSSATSREISYFIDDFKAEYGYKLIVNTYTGDALNSSASDPQGILSQMKSSTAPDGFQILNSSGTATVCFECFQSSSVYIVAISNKTVGKIMRVYDAETLELVLEEPGDSVSDICLDIGIAG